ncbi:hypothetical protein QQZ08_000860 [Neonectria magnoliae]|uniref:Peptidase A1 domain-containing protein n=1 Tax=Neonectria magnoliae TaxID=2732573 RepID=A0ABR1IHL1_9HYPO
MWTTILATGAAFAGMAHAGALSPISIPSSVWQGIDGNWSTVTFLLGSTSQQVDVLVSTALSEFWAVGPGGCLPREPHCSAARGGIYTPQESTDWSPLGTWQLGLDYLGYGGNGDYGQDTMDVWSLNGDHSFHMTNVLMATLNTTNYLNGLFGLGITQGNFGGTVAESPLTQAVKEFGRIPSYSFGFTAGAHYRNVPVSLTLGGYDASRFSSHNIDFTLGRDDGIESPRLRGIEVVADVGKETPENWDSRSIMLSSWDSSFDVIIDSTTPYLWLPEDVCDKFANAFNLTYNSTFDLYTLENEQYRNFLKEDAFSFTFVLSSFDNNDNFGDPYDVPGVVNITVPSRAFTGLLQYPFMNRTITYGQPAIPYFMLRRASNSSTYILGRSFLQESYLITRYDEAVFSIHQAKFPDTSDNDDDLKLIAIEQPDNSPYPPPAASSSTMGLSTAQLAGIGVGAGVFIASLVAFAVWFCKRRQRRGTYERAGSSMEENKNSASAAVPIAPKSPFHRIISKILGHTRLPKLSSGALKDRQQPAEAPDSAIYELPAPVPPAELNGDDAASWTGDTELGTDNSHQMTAYETARRKIDQQLQGPVPAYSPPADGVLPPEKAIYEPTQPSRPPPALQLELSSPRSPRHSSSNSNSIPFSLPSPLTPRYDLGGRPADLPSPMTASIPISSTHNSGSNSAPGSPLLSPSLRSHDERDSLKRSNSNHDGSLASALAPSEPVTQRTPIDVSRIVYLGPLQENMQLQRAHSTQELRTRSDSGELSPKRQNTYDSLGSNFTVEEDELGTTRLDSLQTELQLSPDHRRSGQLRPNRPDDIVLPGPDSLRGHSRSLSQPDTARSQERIDPGTELVHVPQMADRRYSWEDER